MKIQNIRQFNKLNQSDLKFVDSFLACSRLRTELEEAGRLDVSLHCLPNGNYEELQCDSNVCWCAEEKTGDVQIDTVAVTIHLMTYLPCCKNNVPI